MIEEVNRELVDNLPEEYPYKDEGCDLAPSCLSCPFSACRYDETNFRPSLPRLRGQEVWRLRYEQGLSIADLAGRFGVSKRTIHRALRRVSYEQTNFAPAGSPDGSRAPEGLSGKSGFL
ncbi:MAG: sigma-70 region 4 domain-containing protein [Chloroflexi bacterium]|nr:sigma-70 region 4 domain-containing protein [Chloroflexota bacterium]